MDCLFSHHSGWGKALHVPERVQLSGVVEGPLPVMVKRRNCGCLTTPILRCIRFLLCLLSCWRFVFGHHAFWVHIEQAGSLALAANADAIALASSSSGAAASLGAVTPFCALSFGWPLAWSLLVAADAGEFATGVFAFGQ